MSKFMAKLEFEHEEDAKELALEFIRNTYPKSYIMTTAKKVELEAELHQVPEYICKAIEKSTIVILEYGVRQEKYLMPEKNQEKRPEKECNEEYEEKQEEANNQANEEEHEEKQETDSQNKNARKQIARKNAEKVTSRLKKGHIPKETTSQAASVEKIVSIPELGEIAKKASSFEHFAELTGQWLGMKKKKDLWKKLILASTELDKITWSNLEYALKSENVSVTQYDKVSVRSLLKEKLQGDYIDVRTFLKATKQYKDYVFTNAEKDEVEEPKRRIKMECMPENADFEETLANVDKAKPVEERVKQVLNAMGLEELSDEEQAQFLELVTTAVEIRDVNIIDITRSVKIPEDQVAGVYQAFEKFLNNFVKMHESGKNVKTITFFSELQKIIVLENEIQ